MKKFFALFLVVAMLSVAGAAMAASPSVEVSATSLTVKAGSSTQVAVVTAAGNPGGSLVTKVSGASWATLSGNMLTIAPSASVAEGQYNIAVSVTETYTTSDASGHGSIARTASNKATITVSVLPAATAAGTVVVQKVVEVVTTVTKSVTIIATAAREAAVVETFEQVTRSVTEVITTTVLQEVKGFAQALIAVWTAPAKVAAVETKKNAVTATLSNSAGRANVFQYSKVPAGASTEAFTPKANTLLQPATSSIASTATPAQKLAAATAALSGNNKKALSAGEAVKPAESGTFTFPKTFGKALYGTRIGGSRNRRVPTNAGSFSAAAAADDEEGVAFVNSSGDIVNVIPGEENSRDIMPGFVNMLVVMEANEVYEPVVFATTEDLASNDIAVDTTSTDVTVNEVTEKVTEVVVDVKADGSVGDETAVEKADTTVESVLATAMGASSVTMVPATSYGSEISADVLASEDLVATSEDLHVAARIGRAFKELGNGTYYYKVSFDALPSGRTLAAGSEFVFYPDGIVEGTTAYVKVFNEDGTEITTAPASIFGKTGIVAFQIENSGIVQTSNFDNVLANPTVAIKMAASGDVTDAEISRLRTAGYINSSNVLQDAAYKSGSKPSFVASGDIYVLNIVLKDDFPVDDWSAAAATGVDGRIAATGETSAIVLIDRTTLPEGNSSVRVTMHPTSASATSFVTDTWTVSYSSPTGDVGVGSSSSGCSAGSTVLALALLGTFIAARKK